MLAEERVCIEGCIEGCIVSQLVLGELVLGVLQSDVMSDDEDEDLVALLLEVSGALMCAEELVLEDVNALSDWTSSSS